MSINKILMEIRIEWNKNILQTMEITIEEVEIVETIFLDRKCFSFILPVQQFVGIIFVFL